jgi:hypothetical protein
MTEGTGRRLPQPRPILSPRRGERQEDRTVTASPLAILASLRETQSSLRAEIVLILFSVASVSLRWEFAPNKPNLRISRCLGLAPPGVVPMRTNKPNFTASYVAFVCSVECCTYAYKQSVRQAKLVQSSRCESCPVKGSRPAGMNMGASGGNEWCEAPLGSGWSAATQVKAVSPEID